MSADRNFTDQDYELLSAYLDGALPEAERSALETRLQTDEDLRRELDALRQTVTLVSGLPHLKAPRSFALTPDMVRTKPGRWLIFPTSATFSAMAAAAATILLLFGAGMLLLQNGALTSSSPFANAPAALQQEAQSEIALEPTQLPQTVERSAAEDDTQIAQTAAPQDTAISLSGTAPPAPTLVDDFAAPESAGVPSGEGAGGGIPPALPFSTLAPSDAAIFNLAQTTETALTEEQADQILQFAPVDATLVAGATLAVEVMPPQPAAADSGAQTGAEQESSGDTQSSAAAGAVADGTLLVTGTPGAPPGRDRAEAQTATAAWFDRAAQAGTETPAPNPTNPPTATATVTASATPAPTVTVTPPPRPAAPQAEPTDLLAWAALVFGGLLLVVAVVTTVARRRNR